MNAKSNRYKAWLKQSGYDLECARLSFEHEYYEWATYQAEQCVEKALKSVIVHAGERSPKIHKLAVLFGFANSVNPEFRNTKFSFRHVESFTFISRYPFLIPGKNQAPHELISKSDAKQSIAEAEDILGKIEGILQKGVKTEEHPKLETVTEQELKERIDQVRDILVREFNPEKIILFGSYARAPIPNELSTMDILIIANTDLSFVDRIKKARDATRGGLPTIEPLVYTPEEFTAMTAVEGESFLEEALAEGQELHS